MICFLGGDYSSQIQIISSYSNTSKMGNGLQEEFIEREDRYFKPIYLQSIQFHQPSPKYSKFKRLLLKNSYLLPQYLTLSSKKSKHIIKYFTKQRWEEVMFQNGFKIQMEKGEQVQQRIICRSRDKIYAWITQIAQSIIDIQSMGIFHADIQFRNTVIVQGAFKMIDFGYAFKFKLVEGQTQQLSIYQNTAKIIGESLRLAFEQNYQAFGFLFGEIDGNEEQKFFIKDLVNRLSNLNPKQRMIKCVDELWNNGKQQHLRSYCKIVEDLLDSTKRIGSVLGESQINEISLQMKMLKENKRTLKEFIEEVQNIQNFTFNLENESSENYSMDSNIQCEKEGRYYKKVSLQNLQFHYPSLIYSEFQKLLLKNSSLLSQYLSLNNKSRHIIQCFNKKNCEEIIYQNGFTIQMEKGEQVQQRIICRSRDKIYAWITQIAQSIIDIQSMGIFHADIQFRNTVIVQGAFKMIDFGYAFKFKLVEGQTQQLSIYQNTAKIIGESLRLAFEQNYQAFGFLFGEIDGNEEQKFFIKDLVNRLSNLNPKQRMIKCVDELWNNGKQQHLRSYCKIVEDLLDSTKRIGSVLGESQINEISLQMKMLKENKRTLKEFIEEVQNIQNFTFNLENESSENYSMDSNIQCEKEGRYYKKVSLQNLQFHYPSLIYSEFQKLLLKNSSLLSQYLSLNNKSRHIIQCFNKKNCEEIIYQNGFTIQMEKGEQVQQRIICRSRDKIYAWITQIAQSIIDIQSMGIFHADIQFRNTVIVQGAFKMIDFGYAFKFKLVEGQTQQLSIYQNTAKIIGESLRLAFEQNYQAFGFLFGEIDGNEEQKFFIKDLVNRLSNLNPKQRMIKCVDELWNNGKQQHLRSYCKIVEDLLDSTKRIRSVLGESQINEISLQMKMLKENKRTLKEFIEEVQNIQNFTFNLENESSENSSMDSEKEGRYYKKVSLQNLQFHYPSLIYSEFQKLLLKNSSLLSQYLSLNNKSRHIIQCFNKKNCEEIIYQNGFTIQMEKGEQVQEEIICRSRDEIYAWITQIAQSIIDIQSMGIFHADIQFRNTVIVQGAFKMIDFGYAFKFKLVEGETQRLSIYQDTVKMIEECLRLASEQNYQAFLFLFGGIDDNNKEQKDFAKDLVNHLSNLNKHQRMIKCLDKLWNNGKQQHLRSFCRIVEDLLDSTKRIGSVLGERQINEICVQMQMLKESKRNLKEFIEEVQNIQNFTFNLENESPENSLMDSNIKGEKEGRYYKKVSLQNLQFHYPSLIYSEFQKLLLKNSSLLSQYLSLNNKSRHIIQCFNKKNCEEIIYQNGFTIQMEKGEQVQEEIICRSRDEIYAWITQIAQSIIDIQSMGIFHADIQFRNTVIVQGAFKMIDFGYAFKFKLVEGETQRLSIYQDTVKMIEECLRLASEQNYQAFLFLFGGIDDNNKEQKDFAKDLVNHLSNLNKHQRMIKCLDKLWNNGKQQHLRSFCRIVEDLLDSTKRIGSVLGERQINEICVQMQMLKESKRNLKEFIEEVQNIQNFTFNLENESPENSLMDSNIKGEKEGRYYKKVSLQNLQFHYPSLIYSEFQKLLLKNSSLLSQYLSLNNKSRHIIQCFNKKNCEEIIYQNGFTIQMEKGEQVQEEIICRSRDEIYAWITQIAQSIIDIQSMGIFHADIQFRNTVIVQGAFKMIDFGYAFKFKLVEGETQRLSIYQDTVKMIEECLRLASEQNYQAFLFLFGGIDDNNKEQKDFAKDLVNHLSNLNKHQRMIKCLDKLWNNGKQQHLRSFCRIVEDLLDSTKRIGSVLGERQINEICVQMQMLKESKRNLKEFIEEVQQIEKRINHQI